MPYYDKDIVNALSFISASVKDVGFYIPVSLCMNHTAI